MKIGGGGSHDHKNMLASGCPLLKGSEGDSRWFSLDSCWFWGLRSDLLRGLKVALQPQRGYHHEHATHRGSYHVPVKPGHVCLFVFFFFSAGGPSLVKYQYHLK